jgi:hypothetical protein
LWCKGILNSGRNASAGRTIWKSKEHYH